MGFFEHYRLDTCPHFVEESLGIYHCGLMEGKFPQNRCTGNPFMGYYMPGMNSVGCRRYLENEGQG